MSFESLAVIVAGASGVLGGLVVAASNYALNQAQARDARREELRRALRELLYVVGAIDLRLRHEPKPGKATRWMLDKEKEHFPQLHEALSSVSRRLFAPDFAGLIHRFHEAHAAVMLVAPLEMMPAIEAVMDLVATAEEADPEWWKRWSQACGQLVVACRQALGEPVGPQANAASRTDRVHDV